MRNTESADETATTTGLSLADGEAVSQGKASTLDQRRRHLVRGVMAIAPVVLTLRSGALAAASCTGVRIASVTPDADTGAVSGAVDGDVCVQGLQQCPAPHLEKVLTSVSPSAHQTVVGNKCENFKGQPVAILSSQSATSMGIA